jgi:hypothetical protein
MIKLLSRQGRMNMRNVSPTDDAKIWLGESMKWASNSKPRSYDPHKFRNSVRVGEYVLDGHLLMGSFAKIPCNIIPHHQISNSCRALNSCKTKKPAIFSVAGFLLPVRLVVAPQPGLEPGTYGLTVRRSTNWAIEEYRSKL